MNDIINTGLLSLSLANNYDNNVTAKRFGSGAANVLGDSLGDKTKEMFGDSEFGRVTGELFSRGVSSATNTLSNNLLKGEVLTSGLGKNVGVSVAGAGAGIASNYIGLGINSLGGDSMLSRGIGQGVATGLGTVGGTALSNLIQTGGIAGNATKLFGTAGKGMQAFSTGKASVDAAGNVTKAAGAINPYALGATVIGTGLQAAFGPSKEYGGKYGNITKGMDTAYDVILTGVGFIPGYGLAIAGAMALNKGLSNMFGSTDGMCVCAGTKVFTASGDIVNIEDLILELGIIGWSEKFHRLRLQIIKGFIEPKQKECLEFTLLSGKFLRCSIDHPIYTKLNSRWSFIPAIKLKLNDIVGTISLNKSNVIIDDFVTSIRLIGIQIVYNLEASEDHTYIANGIITHNTKQDAILGSAFMPFFAKWANMWGSSKTGSFNKQSWLNTEKTNAFMLDAFGNLQDRFDKARNEAGKVYGTFSQGAKRRALDNLNFANKAWNTILDMTALNEYQNIRSLDMASINNQRYALQIQGGFSPLARGKQGMKILNSAINPKVGMRLLSGAALIDNKAMILSAGNGVKIPKLQTAFLPIEKSDNTRVASQRVELPFTRKQWKEEQLRRNIEQARRKQPVVSSDNRSTLERLEGQKKAKIAQQLEQKIKNQEAAAKAFLGLSAMVSPSYWVEQATGQDLGTVGRLGVDLVSPYILGKGISLLGKAGLGVNKLARFGISPYTGKWTQFGSREYRFKPGYFGMNGAPVEFKTPEQFAYSAEVKSPYYKVGQDGNLTFDTLNVVSQIKSGKQDFISEMLSPEYAETAIRNMEEAERMGLSYTPVFEKSAFKSLKEDGIIPKFVLDPKGTWHGRTSFLGGTPRRATTVEYNIIRPANIRLTTSHESGHVARWGMGESKSEQEFMKHKVSLIFKDEGDVGVYEFGTQTGEAATNMRDLGKHMGITQRTPYPGYEKALEMLENAEVTSSKGGIVRALKLTKEAMPHIWRALLGLHFEYTIPITTAATLYNKSNK